MCRNYSSKHYASSGLAGAQALKFPGGEKHPLSLFYAKRYTSSKSHRMKSG